MSGKTSIAKTARNLPGFSLVMLFAGLVFAAGTAHMLLPEDFAATAQIHPISGIGGRNRGDYQLGSGGGSFTRIESRFAVFDPLFVSNRGSSSFTLTGSEFEASLAGECTFRENVATIGVLTFDPKKLAYVCELSSGDKEFRGSLTLGEPKPRSMRERLLAQAIRVGEAEFGGTRVGIESVHRYAGSKIVSSVPVGYTLTLDHKIAGAVELTDVNPTIFLAPDIDVQERRALLAAALGISVLRDPANSTPGD